MDVIKQMRVRFSGAGEESKEQTGNIRDQRIPPQKTQAFKGEKKKMTNWFRRQFSGEMSQDSAYGIEYSAAVAATAYAINKLEESRVRAQRETNGGPDTAFTKIKSKTEDRITRVTEPPTVSKKLSDEVSDKRPKEAVGPSPSFKRTLTSEDKRFNSTASADRESALPEKATGSTPSIKKTPTFADTNLSSTVSTKPENAVPKPNIPSTVAPTEIKGQPSIKPGTGNTKADTWEKAEMIKIKERYEKLSAKILNWENNKKTKAKRRMERQDAELDRRRGKALEHYRSEIVNIDQIAGGARAQAEENQRNEEFKVKEKANKIRTTGEAPTTCFCC